MGGRTAGAAPERLIVTIPDVNPAVNTTSTTSFDISWFDPTTRTYYLADRSNASVDIIDSRSLTFTGRITGFQGVQPPGPNGQGRSGPNGIVVIQPQNQLWAGDGNSTVKVVDLARGTIINSLSTGGSFRADELAYDATDGILMIANDAEAPPFLTFFSTLNQTFLAQLPFPDATNGIEQSVWSPTTNLFYVAIPATTANPPVPGRDQRHRAVGVVTDDESLLRGHSSDHGESRRGDCGSRSPSGELRESLPPVQLYPSWVSAGPASQCARGL
jgi:hypothetical protein